MPVSQSTMSRLLGRLSAAMGKPFSDAKVTTQATEYANAMGHLPELAVEWAVSKVIRESDKYPKPAELRRLALTCPNLLNGNHDQSLTAQMRRWESDPWAQIQSLDDDRTDCRSAPCPVCGSVIVFSHRGMVITHDDTRHREVSVSYSNMGRAAWLDMPPMTEPEPKKRLRTQTFPSPTMREPTHIGQMLKTTADVTWDESQQARAEAEQVA
jgi:hypothetical protein